MPLVPGLISVGVPPEEAFIDFCGELPESGVIGLHGRKEVPLVPGLISNGVPLGRCL